MGQARRMSLGSIVYVEQYTERGRCLAERDQRRSQPSSPGTVRLHTGYMPVTPERTRYDDLYGTARRALLTVALRLGLRPAGDAALYEAVRAQVSPSHRAVLQPFDRMRRQRESGTVPEATPKDARDVRAIVRLAEHLLG